MSSGIANKRKAIWYGKIHAQVIAIRMVQYGTVIECCNNFVSNLMQSTITMNRSSSYISVDGEQANPETAFTKLMAIPDDTPIKEWKMLLDSMKEECLFEKNIIRNTHGQPVPLHQALLRRRSDNYYNYQRLLKYSKKKRDAEDFRRKTVAKVCAGSGRRKVITLKEFVTEKKMKMLTESSQHESEQLWTKISDRVIQSILQDGKARERLFDESILMERLHFVRREQEAKNDAPDCSIPAKFRGLDPRHMRMPEKCRTESAFLRRKYVHHQKTFQYFKNAMDVEGNLLRTKEAENSLVIRNLMGHFSQQVLAKKDDPVGRTAQAIHRLFLCYANSDSQDINKMFKIISRHRLQTLFETFGIEYKQNQRVINIMQNHQISEFYFLQLLHLLSLDRGNAFHSDIGTFLATHVLTKPHLYLPREWQLYENYKNLVARQTKVRRFRERLQALHGGSVAEGRRFSFDEMVEVMWTLKIYPFMVSKKQLRFFFLYSQCQQIGVSIADIADIYIYIALAKDGPPDQNIKDIIRIVTTYQGEQKQQ